MALSEMCIRDSGYVVCDMELDDIYEDACLKME